MRYTAWTHARMGRLFAVLLAIATYLLLLVVDALRFFPQTETNVSSLFLPLMRFGFSAFVALIFLAVGALVWLYARNRLVALLLFCFSFTLMVAFAVQTAALSGDPLLSSIGGTASSLSVYLFLVLLLLFPRNYLAMAIPSGIEPVDRLQDRRQYYNILLLRGYLIVVTLLSVFTALRNVLYYLLPLRIIDSLSTVSDTYYLLALIGILATIVVIYRQASSLREHQQLRLFASGVMLAFAPFLVLTVLPLVLHLPSRYVVEGQFSVITAVLLPLALGYSILRYQILVFDRYIQRVVAWIVGGVGLAVLGYLVVILSKIFLSGDPLVYVICVALVMAVLGPFVWWLAYAATEKMFFSEIAHYRRLIDTPDLLDRETLDLNEASRLLTVAAVSVFQTSEVCLFVLDEDTGYFRLSPGLNEDDPDYASRSRLLQHLLHVVKPSVNESVDWLESHESIVEHVAATSRPLLLSEVFGRDKSGPYTQLTGLERYLATSSSEGIDALLAPVWTQGKMIGILVLGERGDHQHYAGSDFEAIHLILSRFSPVLETARLYSQASKHVAILNTFYSATTSAGKTFQTIEEVAIDYARVAAEAVTAGAEIWLYDSKENVLHCVAHEGSGPRLTPLERLSPLHEKDWSTWFYEGDNLQSWKDSSSDVPPCLLETPGFPFAWIPLNQGQQDPGMLVLTYPRTHLFSQEEKRVLGMFASQCAATMENAKITLELRAAYERQKELDRLKDQFIMTASHELRTPLTAIQGYIELLSEYNLLLTPEARGEFIAKAHRGCDELTLMVGNIMDASRVEIDAGNIRLSPVPLAASVLHILEILEGMTKRESRSMYVDISPTLLVMADDLRLRQVLLNLISNALKYSSTSSDVAITAEMHVEEVTLRVRDYGLGVPPEDQQHLFNRFMRLDRDMNSPVRGAGLGLYISKQLIEAMGGRIWMESTGNPGEGSTFAFTLKSAMVGQALNQDTLKPQEVL